MVFLLSPLGNRTLSRDELENDKKNCIKCGPCGAGKKALYIGSRFLSRRLYIPWEEVGRVFKRVAMSQGAYTGRGIFGAMSYLVVQYGNGREASCYFKHENELDSFLALIEREHPRIPVHSREAEERLSRAKAQEERRYLRKLSDKGTQTLELLRDSLAFLEREPGLSRRLTAAAKQKRIVDQLKPSVLVLGLIMTISGAALAAYGLYAVLTGSDAGWYFLLGGGALFFFALSAGIVPGRWTSRKKALLEWEAAVEASRAYTAGREDFPVPPQYSHTTVLTRMIRIVREGRAEEAGGALSVLKADLRALNSSVRVSQEEHDEVAEIKPLFLVCSYE